MPGEPPADDPVHDHAIVLFLGRVGAAAAGAGSDKASVDGAQTVPDQRVKVFFLFFHLFDVAGGEEVLVGCGSGGGGVEDLSFRASKELDFEMKFGPYLVHSSSLRLAVPQLWLWLWLLWVARHPRRPKPRRRGRGGRRQGEKTFRVVQQKL